MAGTIDNSAGIGGGGGGLANLPDSVQMSAAYRR